MQAVPKRKEPPSPKKPRWREPRKPRKPIGDPPSKKPAKRLDVEVYGKILHSQLPRVQRLFEMDLKDSDRQAPVETINVRSLNCVRRVAWAESRRARKLRKRWIEHTSRRKHS